jgi:hypothetical protein
LGIRFPTAPRRSWEVVDTSDDPSNPAPGTLRYLVLHAEDHDIIRFAEGKNTIALKATLEIGTASRSLAPRR